MKNILKKTLVILKIIFGVLLSIVLSVCLLMVLLFLPKSCSHSDEYIVTYPQKYTTAYCEENYIRADPNLIHLIAAENEIGKIEIPGGWGYYRAIKDVSMEDYLVMTKVLMFGINGRDIVKNKNNDALPEQEILSYHIKKIEIYKNEKSLKELYHIDVLKLGNERVTEVISSFDGEKADRFQSDLIECLEKGNYKNGDEITFDIFELNIRITFDNYEYLVWDGGVIKSKEDNKLYIVFYKPTDGLWKNILIPLNNDIAELVPDFE